MAEHAAHWSNRALLAFDLLAGNSVGEIIVLALRDLAPTAILLLKHRLRT